MKAPTEAVDEARRLDALESTHLVYSPAEERFDRITRLAARHFEVPVALVSLVARDRQWFKSAQGIAASETSREVSFCGHAILSENALVITDTVSDPDFADNPLVLENPQIRFYAGHPLRVDGMAIGTLCVIDRRPRDFSVEDLDSLQTLAAYVELEVLRRMLSEPEQNLLDTSSLEDRQRLIDPIAQTWNEVGLNVLLTREIEYAVSNRRDYALIAIEFATPGQEVGRLDPVDQESVVRKVAQLVRSALRPYDLIARTGAKELVIFAPRCDADLSELLVQRVQTRVSVSPIQLETGSISVDLKAGVVLGDAESTPDHLLEFASQALEDAKASGQLLVRYVA